MSGAAKKIFRLVLTFIFGLWFFSLILFGLDKIMAGRNHSGVPDFGQEENGQEPLPVVSEDLKRQKFRLKFDTAPKNAGYVLIASDGAKKKREKRRLTMSLPADEQI